MGTFAEIADVDYRLPFANQGRQISIFRFRLQQQTAEDLAIFLSPFTISSSCKRTVCRFSLC
jgi:hypothetical protein